jgi:hypothetical protein
MLDPARVSQENRKRILSAFSALKEREVMDFEDEIGQEDRLAFESTVLDAYSMGELLPKIKQAALELHKIRNAATK